jgi:hypothetical protein
LSGWASEEYGQPYIPLAYAARDTPWLRRNPEFQQRLLPGLHRRIQPLLIL